jgi:hypothetical protein
MHKIFTSEEILSKDDLYDLQDMASMGQTIYYKLTEAEKGWVDFVRGRYPIADYIDQNETDGILAIDAYEMSKALDEDCEGFGKGVCLSDDTGLQRLFFWLYGGDGICEEE